MYIVKYGAVAAMVRAESTAAAAAAAMRLPTTAMIVIMAGSSCGGSAAGSTDATGTVIIEPWGQNSLRVRVARPGRGVNSDLPTAVLPRGSNPPASSSGNLAVEPGSDGVGRRFIRLDDRRILWEEESIEFFEDGGLRFRIRALASNLYAAPRLPARSLPGLVTGVLHTIPPRCRNRARTAQNQTN